MSLTIKESINIFVCYKERQNERDDRLGINGFLIQPIQRLPKYKLLLSELIKELGKNLEEDGVKQQIASCCKAEKNVQRLLDTINESMHINDIVDCYDVHLFCPNLKSYINSNIYVYIDTTYASGEVQEA